MANPWPFRLLIVIVIGLALLAWLGLSQAAPVIVTVPVVKPGGDLEILGTGFGGTQGANQVLLSFQDESQRSAQVKSWSTQRIVLQAPEANGAVQVVRKRPLVARQSNIVPFVVQAQNLPSQPYDYEVPVQPEAPWPTFRRDQRNTGRSPLPAIYGGDQPWAFRTGKGIFSTPVIDGEGTIYVGSADHIFYALNPDGTEKWRFETGEIIDSAGALPRPGSGGTTVIFPSADGHLYHLAANDGSLLWAFEAPGEAFNNWWEGNIAVGYDGVYLAGNTNFNYYAISPDGELRWVYETGANAWSIAGLAADATIFWGSNDTYVRAVDPAGQEKWRTMTLGFIAASAAVGPDGAVYIGSFDSYLYALDPATGHVRWKFKTNDHIYSSAALAEDAIYFGSTDGSFYALSLDGELLWSYDTGDPIRSSPALGAGPSGGEHEIVYFGAGNGKLYALNTADGSRRWSFDTTPEDAELRDRNDLNGSPALGVSGVIIGGEHGYVWYVPYDYCLLAGKTNPRCRTDPGENLPDDVAQFFYVTPGGSTLLIGTPEIPIASIITLRLVVREAGQTMDASVCNSPVGCPEDALQVSIEPPVDLSLEKSADGHFLHIIPEGYLQPDTAYTIRVQGHIYTGGLVLGNLTLGGRQSGRFDSTVSLRTLPTNGQPISLSTEADQVAALEWTRLAVPIPPMMPSLNQIGFDYIDWILGTVEMSAPDDKGAGKLILWAIGGQRNEEGVLIADPGSDFTLPLSGTYQDNAFILRNQNFTMPITGIPIPFNLMQLRGQLGPEGIVDPGATAYADTEALSIPTFGPYLVIAGLANNVYQKLLVTGTYITRPYLEQGSANRRPDGITVASLEFAPPTGEEAGLVQASFELAPGAHYRADEHRPGILLIDLEKGEAVFLDYHANLEAQADHNGDLASVSLTLPPDTTLPSQMEAVVLLDVFPVYRQALTARASSPSQ